MGRVVHFEVHCDDLDRAERFYTEVFDWTIQRWEGAPIDYRLVTTGSDTPGINGALTQRDGAIDGKAITAYVNTVEVAGLDQAEHRIAEAGGQRVTDRQRIPGVGEHAYFKDTEGNVFGVLEPEPSA